MATTWLDGEEGAVPIFDTTPPMPTLEQLARCAGPPADEVRTAILDAADRQDNAYWVHAEVHQRHPSVTIGQVAIVLLDHPDKRGSKV